MKCDLSQLVRPALVALVFVFVLGCAQTESDTATITGAVNLGSGLANSSVTVVAVDRRGEVLETLGTTTTDNSGKYSLQIDGLNDIEGHILVKATSDSFGGGSLESRVVQLTEGTNSISVNPFTDISSHRAKSLMKNKVSVISAIEASDKILNNAVGFKFSESLPSIADTVLGLTTPDSAPVTSAAAAVALRLGAFMQLAVSQKVSAFALASAFTRDFENDGKMDGADRGIPVQISDLNIDTQLWSKLDAAQTQLVTSSTGNANGNAVTDQIGLTDSNPKTLMGTFSILTPALTAPGDTGIQVTWEPSAGAVMYELSVGTQADCQDKLQTFEGVVDTQQTLDPLDASGTYYICLTANDAGTQSIPALNSSSPAGPFSFTIEPTR